MILMEIYCIQLLFWPGGYEYGFGEYFDVSKNGDVCVTGSVYLSPNVYIFTAKYNSSGILQWSKVFRTDIYNTVFDIKIDKLGNVNIVGSAIIGAQGFALLIHYNQSGDTSWVKYFNNNQNTASYRKITLDNLNNIYVEGNISNIGKCLISKYDINGNQQWFNTFTYDASRSNLGRGISVDLLGNVYIIGTQAKPQSQYDAYLLKLNNSGQIQWDYPYPGYGTGNNSLWGPVITKDGNSIYYTASVHDTVGIGYNIATIKINAQGTLQWAKVYNGGISNGLNLPADIKLDRFDNVYVAGTGYYQITGNDYLVLKYNPSGNLIWTVNYEGIVTNGDDAISEILLDSNTNFVVTGNSRKIQNSYSDAVTIKYNQPIGISTSQHQIPGENELNQNFPNPFNPITNIRFSIAKNSVIQLKIFDVLGRIKEILVNEKLIPSEYELTFDGSSYSSGVYFYQLTSDGNIVDIKKLVIIK